MVTRSVILTFSLHLRHSRLLVMDFDTDYSRLSHSLSHVVIYLWAPKVCFMLIEFRIYYLKLFQILHRAHSITTALRHHLSLIWLRIAMCIMKNICLGQLLTTCLLTVIWISSLLRCAFVLSVALYMP